MAHKWPWSGSVTKFVILHPLNYFCHQCNRRGFKFYTELNGENYNIHTQEYANF